ncbi:hypothetical protein V6N13_106152 [Hibiscus sabdariffa]
MDFAQWGLVFTNGDGNYRWGLKLCEVVIEDGEGRLGPGDQKILPQNKGKELNDKNGFQMVNTSIMGNGVFGGW